MVQYLSALVAGQRMARGFCPLVNPLAYSIREVFWASRFWWHDALVYIVLLVGCGRCYRLRKCHVARCQPTCSNCGEFVMPFITRKDRFVVSNSRLI